MFMANNSSIEWTDATWNPTTGCTRASAGCDHCYAFTMTKRLAAMGQEKYQGLAGKGHFNGFLQTWMDELARPLRWKKPRNVFVNSMSDLFHAEVPFEFIDHVFAVMALCGQHTFQILTKRPERMAEYLAVEHLNDRIYSFMESHAEAEGIADFLFDDLPLANVWLGTSVEDQPNADERIPHLLRCPAAVRFLSCEPLLGPLDLTAIERTRATGFMRPLDGRFNTINWVIVGGESGHHARPMHPSWAQAIRDQCTAAGVPFFFKQWGEWIPICELADGEHRKLYEEMPPSRRNPEGYQRYRVPQHHFRYDPKTQIQGHTMFRIGKKAAGRMLDGREWNEYPVTERASA
jgi:protein gp37